MVDFDAFQKYLIKYTIYTNVTGGTVYTAVKYIKQHKASYLFLYLTVSQCIVSQCVSISGLVATLGSFSVVWITKVS